MSDQRRSASELALGPSTGLVTTGTTCEELCVVRTAPLDAGGAGLVLAAALVTAKVLGRR